MSFRDRQRCRIALSVAFPAILVLYFVLGQLGLLETWFGMLIMPILPIADLIAIFVIWQCPYCKRILPFRWNDPHFCPNCGAQLSKDGSDGRARKNESGRIGPAPTRRDP